MIRRTLTALIALIALCGAYTASQAAMCADKSIVEESLRAKYGESVRGIGFTGSPVALMQIWVNPQTRTWTITTTYASGMLCLMASGEGWGESEPALPGDDS